ncbi:DUF262 domain-containing protein [Wenyingzhuangia sp. 2_MG-2023]|uniref:GmrSD restriction endonuclease domain-containing protein n=1 Tax=Wenyingzhuangia sp. 2_MG-2023 TaxID=3062639 RepID=UPI0026E1FBB8|nr:DUF262 domain-containing protein [Wenyingzhuangia sp. 2_MG-2023]MDO6738734.1 DUF262 domain-containing protein [Wenyingzhuangia sp. 2_MG-2023]
MMNENNTLWSILNQYGIEIPPIQRDFAQGRETEHANKVRKGFLNSIAKALDNNETLSLDFVYGKIYGLKNEEENRKNKNAIQSMVNSIRDYALTVDLTLNDVLIEDKSSVKSDLVYLIPLDGQQRLTTLFLIHWYIAKRIGNIVGLKVLSRFRYKTRKSSTSFLKLLTDEQMFLNFEEEEQKEKDLKEKKLYNEITNLEYFSSSWLNDPTVKAMLIMIQDIHIRWQSKTVKQLKEYWVNLTENQLLWFDFLDLKDFNLSDELYVKMNARGKQLSYFENFKAWLFDVIKEKELIEKSVWVSHSKKFDVEWSDIFWNQKGDIVFDVDNAYFNFFKLLFLYDNLKEVKLNETNFDVETKEFEVLNIVTNNKYFDWEYLCDELFEKNIINHLQVLAHCEGKFIEVKDKYLKLFFEFQFSEKGIKPTWPNLIKNFITLSFISNKGKPLKEYSVNEWNQLREYHRILFNLFDNTIIDKPSLYQNAVKEIDQLNIDLKILEYNIGDWVESFEYTTKSVFTEQQLLEEVLKYRLFANDEWKNIILEAEKTTYFERQLNFWFFRAKISLAKEEFDIQLLGDLNKKENFKNTTLKINKLFDEKGIHRKEDFSEHIFERAMLSNSNYLLTEKGYQCFGSNKGRDVSWKRLFLRDKNSKDTNSALLEIFDLDFSNVKDSFQLYIDQNISTNNIDDWRLAFVNNKELFNYLGNLKYIRNISNHGWVLIKDGYKTYTGAHYELFSLDFYIKHLKGNEFSPFNKVAYYTAPKNTIEDFPCAYLDWQEGHSTYTLDVKFINEEYSLVFFAKEEGTLSNKVKSIIEHRGFIANDNIYKRGHSKQSDVINEINTLTIALEKLKRDI